MTPGHELIALLVPFNALIAGWAWLVLERPLALVVAAALGASVLVTMLLGLRLCRMQKRQAAALEDLSARDRLLREAHRVGACGHLLYDPADDLFVPSEALESIAGIDATYPHDLAGWVALVHLDDRAEFEHRLRSALDAKLREFGGNFRIFRASDGKLRHLHGSAIIDYDVGGKPARIVALVQDRTEQVAAQSDLRESEARFRAFFDNAMIGMGISSPEKRWLMANPALCEMLGYTESELTQRTWAELTLAEDLGANLEKFECARAGSIDGYSMEKRFVRSDGRVIDASITARAVRDRAGQLDFLAVSYRDISARKAAEKALRQTAELLEAAGAVAGVGGWSLEPSSMLLNWTAQTCRIHELPDGEQVTVDRALAFYAPEHRPRMAAALDAAIGSGTDFDLEAEIITARGRRIWVRAMGRAESIDGEVRRVYGALVDVDQRHRLQEALRDGHDVLRSILETTADGYWRTDASGRMIDVNQGYCRQSGYTREELLGMRIVDLDASESPAETARHMSRIVERGSDRFESTHRRKDGSIWNVEVSTTYRQSGGGEFLVFLQDISERKRLEVQALQELERSRELNRKLEHAHNQLLQAEKMAAIGQLAAGVAHELNNPIGFIKSNIGSLETYVGDLLEIFDHFEGCAGECQNRERQAAFRRICEEKEVDFIRTDVRQLMAECKDGAERVRRIVLSLKDFSHLSDKDWAWADLHAGLESTLTLVASQIGPQARIERHYGDLPEVFCMPSQINQVFMNVLVNAAQAIEGRGRILISTGREGDRVWIEIGDSGPGIRSEHLNRIFEPFFTTKPVGTGTGLGLSIAWGIVDRHRGRLSVRSTPDVGTTFRIELPIRASAA